MKNIFLILLGHTLIFSFAEASSNQCSQTHLSIISKLKRYENRLDFSNDGGLFGGGVCWWHSRFERAAVYLAEFQPSLKKPTSSDLRNILLNITYMKTVKIPGYRNLQHLSSSSENEEIIQNILNNWQLRDGLIRQAWIKGLSGYPRMEASKLKIHMREIFRTFNQQKKPHFLMLQLPGLVAHSFLLIGMREVSKGYELLMLDPNSPGRLEYYDYHYDSTSMKYKGEDFIPYLGFVSDFRAISQSVDKICKGQHF
jgi:hypothetical protein